jgi:hypothetical protein
VFIEFLGRDGTPQTHTRGCVIAMPGRLATGGDDFLLNIVTADDSWFHYFDSEIK